MSSTASSSRTVSTFSWELVDAGTVRKLLEADGVSVGGHSDGIADLASRHFGRTGGKKHLLTHAGVLRDAWLPKADAQTVTGLALTVQHIVNGEDRWVAIDTKALALEFLKRRNLSKNMRANLVRSFLTSHKEPRVVRVRPSGSRERDGLRILRGEGSARPAAWPHQKAAGQALDRHMAKSPGQGTLLVLPTGSGKTETVVEWLLDRLEKDPAARVLWIVHQQELVNQSVERFAACAKARSASFIKRARAIHGAGSPLATLAEPELDIVSVTIQTLFRCMSPEQRSKLATFVRRPTFVVVDEAHHAASPSYSRVLDFVAKRGTQQCLIGLTATPWPSSMAAHQRLQKRFPQTAARVDPEELISTGILARPILHTAETGLRLYLAGDERSAAERNDFSSATLARLNVAFRNRAVVESWRARQKEWGKTLVFAVSIDHADALTTMFANVGANVKVVHSRSESGRTDSIEWFRKAKGSAVLVSVGMLNEGVDLPDAKTAFLARPTTSRILLRQMIGRVLRGPRARGTAEANVVWFQDGWENFGEVLDPSIVLPDARRVRSDHGSELLPPLVDDSGRQIPVDLEAEVAMSLAAESLPMLDADHDGEPDEGWVALDPLLISSRLVGYYELIDRRLPVFEHQRPAFEDLIKAALATTMQGRALLSWFDDTHPPYPSQRALVQVVEFSRELGCPPPFVELDALIGPSVGADRLLAAGPLTDIERTELLLDIYETTIARAAYATFDRFDEAVEQELRARRRGRRYIEQSVAQSTVGCRKRPRAQRELEPRWRATVDQARTLLPPQIRMRLAVRPAIEVDWTRRVVTSTWGHWSIRLRGKSRGRQTIRINRVLRTTPSIVPDSLLEYILYHELLHHLLPGEGHDAEFNELEAHWPGRDELDLVLATFHEHWDTRPGRYLNDGSA